MRVILTGSRALQDPVPVYEALGLLLKQEGPFTLVHGACATGADHWAHNWYEVVGRFWGVTEIRFEAEWDKYGNGAGPVRNKKMIAAGGDLVLAFPESGGRGTQHTMDLARTAGIPVDVHERGTTA